MDDKDLVAEYLALKAANDRLREQGKQWLWETLDALAAGLNRSLPSTQAGQAGASIQIGRQEGWQFSIDNTVMVGERYGARLRGRTLIVEAGWPRLPEHGFISDGGLARGRIGLSQNTVLQAQPLADLILKRQGAGVFWYAISYRQLGEQLTEAGLEHYLRALLRD